MITGRVVALTGPERLIVLLLPGPKGEAHGEMMASEDARAPVCSFIVRARAVRRPTRRRTSELNQHRATATPTATARYRLKGLCLFYRLYFDTRKEEDYIPTTTEKPIWCPATQMLAALHKYIPIPSSSTFTLNQRRRSCDD